MQPFLKCYFDYEITREHGVDGTPSKANLVLNQSGWWTSFEDRQINKVSYRQGYTKHFVERGVAGINDLECLRLTVPADVLSGHRMNADKK